STPKP
ncbi:hypothetical protein D027_4686B, partial [Vibrio parahaemolyticus 861]